MYLVLPFAFQSNRLKNEVKASAQCIITLELLIEQNKLVSQDKFGEIKCWQIDSFKLALNHTISTKVISFCKAALHKDNVLLCKGENSSINYYSVVTLDKIKIVDPLIDKLGNLMAIKSVGDYVFCGYEANMIIVWYADRIIDQYSCPELECLMTLDVDRNITKGVCAGSSDIINIFSITNNKMIFKQNVKITNPGINVLQLRPDDKIVAAACWDLTVRLFSWKTMKLLVILETYSTGVVNIMFSELSVKFWKTKYMLAVANKDNKITLWDVYNKKDDN